MAKLNKKFNQKKATSYKTMQKRTALRCGYHLYEVEDVLNAYLVELKDAMINHEVVDMSIVGKLGSRIQGERTFKSGLTNEMVTVVPKAKFLFVPSVLVKESTNASITSMLDNPADSSDVLDEND